MTIEGIVEHLLVMELNIMIVYIIRIGMDYI